MRILFIMISLFSFLLSYGKVYDEQDVANSKLVEIKKKIDFNKIERIKINYPGVVKFEKSNSSKSNIVFKIEDGMKYSYKVANKELHIKYRKWNDKFDGELIIFNCSAPEICNDNGDLYVNYIKNNKIDIKMNNGVLDFKANNIKKVNLELGNGNLIFNPQVDNCKSGIEKVKIKQNNGVSKAYFLSEDLKKVKVDHGNGAIKVYVSDKAIDKVMIEPSYFVGYMNMFSDTGFNSSFVKKEKKCSKRRCCNCTLDIMSLMSWDDNMKKRDKYYSKNFIKNNSSLKKVKFKNICKKCVDKVCKKCVKKEKKVCSKCIDKICKKCMNKGKDYKKGNTDKNNPRILKLKKGNGSLALYGAETV